MQRIAVLLTAILSLRCATIDVQPAPQRYATGPAATLLLPYFETSDSLRYDTTLTVTNTADTEHAIRITFWTDHGFATLWFNESISPHTTRTLSVARILTGSYILGAKEGHARCDNVEPGPPDCAGHPIPPPVLGNTNCLLRGSAASPCQTRVSERHAHAIGYVTVDVVSGDGLLPLTDPRFYATMLNANVLTGTYEQRADGAVLASGPLVHLAARDGLSSTFYGTFSHGDDHREPLPTEATVAFPDRGETVLHIWTEPTTASSRCEDFARPVVTSRRIRRWRRRTTIRAEHQTWITISNPIPPDPSATPPPERCERVYF